jgi:methyl-accepting chemotaxis protein
MTNVATAIAEVPPGQAAGHLIRDIRAKLSGAKPTLLVLFASPAHPLAELAPAVAAEFPGTTLLGASSAGEFTHERDAKGAATLFALAGDYQVFAGMGAGLHADPERAMNAALEGLPQQIHGYRHRTALLLLDPLAGNGEETTLLAASLLGDAVRLAGGAAGDDLAMKATQVALGARVASDAVVVALLFSKKPLGVGVCHGHEPLSAPLRVSRAEGNIVHTIEGRPAWDVWLEQTRDRARAAGIGVPTAAEEGAYLLRYEAGLAAGDSYKIRAPLTRAADGSISFACGIPQGAVIRITESVPERQIASAREAARRARAQLGGEPPAGALVFDCICRNLILKAEFVHAVRAMSEELGNVPLAGFETYGEIALDVGDMSGFHNTTSVVLAFPQG